MTEYFITPTGAMAAGLVDAIGHQLAAELAEHSRNEDRVRQLMQEARELVGDETVGKVLYVALGTLATGILGPLLEAADAAGWTAPAQMLAEQAATIHRMVDRQVKK